MLTFVSLFVCLFLAFVKSSAPGITGVSCSVVENQLYVFGGVKAVKEASPNFRVYSLNLAIINSLSNTPGWTDTGFDLSRSALYSTALTLPSTSKGSGKVLVVGGKNVKLTDGVTQVTVNGGSLTQTDLKKPSNLTDLNSPSIPLQFYPYGGGFVQNDLNPDQFLFFGGFFFSNDQVSTKFSPINVLYSLKDDTWTSLNVSSNIVAPPVYYSTYHAYKGNVYVIGGASTTTDTAQPLNKIYKFSFNSFNWSLVDASGDSVGDRYLHSSTLIGSKVYVVGGTDGNLVNDVVAVLDLDLMKWTKKQVQNLEAKSQGCLASYQNKLVYGFGFSAAFNSTVQVVDIANSDTFKMVQYLSPKEPVPLSTILGAAIGGSLGFILLILIAFFLYRRHKKIQKAREEYLKQYDAHLKAHNQFFSTEDNDLNPNEKTEHDPAQDLALSPNSDLFRPESEYLEENRFSTNATNIDSGLYASNPGSSNQYSSALSHESAKKDKEATLISNRMSKFEDKINV